MSFKDDFPTYLDTLLTIYPYSSENDFGEKIFGTSYTAYAYVVKKTKNVGGVMVSESYLLVDPNDLTILNKKDKISFKSITPIIRDIKELDNEDGPYVVKIDI